MDNHQESIEPLGPKSANKKPRRRTTRGHGKYIKGHGPRRAMHPYGPAKICIDNANGLTNDALEVVNEPAQDSTGDFFVGRHEEPMNSALPDGLYNNLRIYNDHLMQADQRLRAADERLRAADARFDQHCKDDNLRFDQHRKDDNLRFDKYQDRYNELWKDYKKEAAVMQAENKKEAADMQAKIDKLVEKNAELATHSQLYHQYLADVEAQTEKIQHLIDENRRLAIVSEVNKKDAADHGSSKKTIKELEQQRDRLKWETDSFKTQMTTLRRDSDEVKAELRAKRQREQGYTMMFVLAIILAILAYLASCVVAWIWGEN